MFAKVKISGLVRIYSSSGVLVMSGDWSYADAFPGDVCLVCIFCYGILSGMSRYTLLYNRKSFLVTVFT